MPVTVGYEYKMKIFIAIFFGTISFFGCSDNSNSKPEPPLLESDTYWDYSKFIQENPNSVHFEEALQKYLFLRDCTMFIMGRHNDLEIVTNINDSVYLDGLIFPLDSVKIKCYQYLTKQGYWKDYYGLTQESINPFTNKTITISEGGFDIEVISDSTPYSHSQKTVIEVVKAIEKYKNYCSLEWFKKDLSLISQDEKTFLDSLLGYRLEFMNFDYSTYTFPKDTNESEDQNLFDN